MFVVFDSARFNRENSNSKFLANNVFLIKRKKKEHDTRSFVNSFRQEYSTGAPPRNFHSMFDITLMIISFYHFKRFSSDESFSKVASHRRTLTREREGS